MRLGYEFNIASRAFNAIGVDTNDLGNVPELLRGILEETLSQEASQASLDNFLPRIRDIIINLLHGLKKKQQRLRQRTGRDGSLNGGSPRQGSVGSNNDAEDAPQQARASSQRLPARNDENGINPDLPPRSSSVAGGRVSPSKYESLPSNPRANRNTGASQNSTDSSMSSGTAQQIPVVAPYPADDTMPDAPPEPPSQPAARPNYPVDFPPPPPPPAGNATEPAGKGKGKGKGVAEQAIAPPPPPPAGNATEPAGKGKGKGKGVAAEAAVPLAAGNATEPALGKGKGKGKAVAGDAAALPPPAAPANATAPDAAQGKGKGKDAAKQAAADQKGCLEGYIATPGSY